MKNKKEPWKNNFRYHKRYIEIEDEITRILIICEGEKTEPNYFKSFPVDKTQVEITTIGTGFNTKTLIKKAIEEENKAKKKKRPYHQIWCVFDKDSFSDDDFNTAIFEARTNKMKVAWSNEAFELWYLLHFIPLTSAISRKQYCKKLTELLDFKYEKNNKDMYKKLKSKQKDAISNAEMLEQHYVDEKYSRHNPSTRVHHLVNKLNEFLLKSE